MEKYCVRVKSNGKTGSGVILPGKETFYVLTAAHCFDTIEPQIGDFIVQKQSDYTAEFTEISCLKLVEFNLDHDFALIEVELDLDEQILCQYKLAKGILSENGIRFCGYQGINENQYRPFNGKVLSVSEANKKFKVTLLNDTFDQGGEDGSFIAKGLSGSGVFIYRHNSPFLIGILNSVISDKAWNDDINCCSILHLQEYISEYVDLSNWENLVSWNENIEKNRTQKEIEDFKNGDIDFFDKLYRKNQVLYPSIEQVDKITAKQIRKYIAMKDNVKAIENHFPVLFSIFKNIVKRFVDQVEDDYSRNVDKSSEAVDKKIELQEQLKKELEVLPFLTNIDLSDYQLIEWLGVCTLNFTKND